MRIARIVGRPERRRRLKRSHPRFGGSFRCEPTAKRQAERLRLDLEYVAFPRLDAVAERQGRGPEEMDMNVARPPEQGILEMMRLEIGDRMGHVLFAGQECLFPDDFVPPPDARDAMDVGR